MKLDIRKLQQSVRNAADLTDEAREQSERDRDYTDGHQWTAEEIAILQRRKQPIVTINRIRRKVDAMIGLEQRMRADPKAYPRNPNDQEVADVSTKALVYVDDDTRFDAKRSDAFENLVVEGYGGVEVVVEEIRGKFEVVINRLRWEEIFFDPHSREKDFSDAAFIGTQKWLSIDAAVELLAPAWQGEEEDLIALLETSLSGDGSGGDTYEDRPWEAGGFRWADRRQKRVRVANMYYRNRGKWYLAIFCGSPEAIYHEESPYLDEDGNTACPIELMTAYIDRENRRYGVVRSMISQQDEINKRRSKLLHQLNSRQTFGIKGALDSVADMKRELDNPDGHVEINVEAFMDAMQAGVKPFDFVPNNDQVSGQFSLLQESKAEIDMLGPNPSLIGQTEGAASGRAIMAQQQAGMAELAPLYDSLRDWNLRVYRAVWARIKQFWTDERWVRVTDQYGQNEWLGINVPVGYVQVIDMQTGQPVMQPQFENIPAEMDVDILIEDAPDHVTLQQEQFEQLTTMAQNGIPIPPEMIIEASQLRNKTELLEMLQMQRQQQAQAQQEALQAKVQIEGMKAQASAQRDSATAQKYAADAEKTNVETFQMARGLR